MQTITTIKHLKGAPGLRILGLGPKFIPCKGLQKLRDFLNNNTFWGGNRKLNELKSCLLNSDVIVSIWIEGNIIGFGRALSDGIYRGVLWDVVIDKKHQGKGYGTILVKTLLNSEKIKKSKKVYLMTTNKKDFYCQLDFKEVSSQSLLIREI